jgi:hypothetical protein
MQIEQWPAYGTSEFIAAYGLGEAEPRNLVTGRLAPEVSAVSAIWTAVCGLSGATAMILRTAERLWIAAGTVLVEGRTGLNMGLLLPSIRGLPAPTPGEPAGPARFADPYHRTVWDVAERVARVEHERVMLFRAGGDHAVHATRDGFAMLGKDTLESFRSAVRSTVAKHQHVSYSLGTIPDSVPELRHSVAELFAQSGENDSLRLAPDGWPEDVPHSMGFAQLAFAVALAQRLEASAPGDGVKLTVTDHSARQVFSAAREVRGWTVRQAPSGA